MSCENLRRLSSKSFWLPLLLSGLAMLWFFGFLDAFGPGRSQSVLGWLSSAWNGENDFEHGWMTLPIILGLLWLKREEFKKIPLRIAPLGLVFVVLGILIYIVAWRVIQPRIAVFALPMTLSGAIWYLGGYRLAKATAFPIFFILLAIPMPFFTHATVGLQILATQAAHIGSMLFGISTYVEGTTLMPANDLWSGFKIAEGCSGMRSLMALVMLAAAWAYLSPLVFWKQCLIFLSSIPLAILGNAARITSIFVVATWIGPEFASGTWHDWSGLLLFFPLSMLGLFLIQTLLSGKNPFRRKKIVVRKNISQTKES